MKFDLVFYRSEENDSIQKKVEHIEAENLAEAEEIAFEKMGTEYQHHSSVEIFVGGMAFEYGYFLKEITRMDVMEKQKNERI